MIWQIDAAVADASFWDTSLPTLMVTLAVVISVPKKGNSSSLPNNIS